MISTRFWTMKYNAWAILIVSLAISFASFWYVGLSLFVAFTALSWTSDEITFFIAWNDFYNTWYNWIGIVWFCFMAILLTYTAMPLFGFLSLLSVIWVVPSEMIRGHQLNA